MKLAIVALLFAALTLTADAELTQQQWQARAVERYPELGIQGSPLNKRFIAEHNQRRKTSRAFFADPKWPLTLADELAAPPSTPPPTEQSARWISEQWSRIPPDFRLPVGIGAGAIALIFIFSCLNSFKCRLHWKRLCADHDAYLDLAQSNGAIPTVQTKIMLRHDEQAYYSAPSALYETRAVRHYQSGFVGFRVAKGIYVGGSQGRSVSNQEWTKIAAGVLTVTNKRIIFDGDGSDRTLTIPKVISVEPMRDSVEVSVENRQKSMVFAAANPLILASIIRMSCDVHLSMSEAN